MSLLSRFTAYAAWYAVLALLPAAARAGATVYPTVDGTLADGGGMGVYDGVADAWNWEFSSTGFAGAVSKTTETPVSAVEHRIVCKYDLRTVPVTTPVEATLTFATRGARAFPFPDVSLHVYSYPAHLLDESPADFSAGPATLMGVVTVTALQTRTTRTLDISEAVTSALQTGVKKLALRFQIDPNTPHVTNQVFIDMLDTEPSTKPFLTIYSAVPGDADDDGDADLNDFATFMDCLAGPGVLPVPAGPGTATTSCLRVFDHEGDEDVDLRDLSNLLRHFARQ